MPTPSYTPLPYTFDLLYDLKCVEHLHAHLKGEMRFHVYATDAELVQTMIEHNIPMPEGYVPPAFVEMTPDDCRARYAELLEVVRQIHHHAKQEALDAPTELDRNWILTQTGKALAKHPGLNEDQRAAYENPSLFRDPK